MDFNQREEVDRIGEQIRNVLVKRFRRRGPVVAISGGIDSSDCPAIGVV
ncbi:MAG: hypothetical protein GY765_07575 [bacterium]|nr:hypothetical protein [bacterium]